MNLIELPQELLNLITSFADISTLRAIRQVNRTWGAIATKHLFQSITFTPDEINLPKWHSLISDSQLRLIPRHATVNSNPVPDYDYWNTDGEKYETLANWNPSPEDEKYEVFYKGIESLSKLLGLESVTLHFVVKCEGVDGIFDHEDVENIEYRTDILKRFFKALQQRSKDCSEASKITTLIIEHLQNVPLPELTTSDSFKFVMEGVEHLNLVIAEEYNEAGPDHDYKCIERRTFPPYFIDHWLKPISSQLKSLSLEFPEPWGPLPGYFDAQDLKFPKLEKMTLTHYCIAHNDSIDWILRQQSLRSLRLYHCQIATYFMFRQGSLLHEWKVPKHDWETQIQPPESADGELFFYPGTWNNVFHQIYDGLPLLSNMSVVFKEPNGGFEASSASPESWKTRNVGWTWHEDSGVDTDTVPEYRYVSFHERLLPSQWNEPYELALTLTDEELAEKIPKRAEETEEADTMALRRLLTMVHDRQRDGKAGTKI